MDPMAQKYYGLSPYAYCAGDPVNLVDPEGLEKIKAVQNPNISSAADNFPENEGVIHIWAHGNSNAI